MSWIDTGDWVLRYRIDGNAGPWVVLVHELGMTLESWDAVVPHLASDWRVLRLDLPGAGLSEKLLRDISLEVLADAIAGLLSALEINGPVTICGCSMGAAVALTFAADHPARTAAVVAMSPSVGTSEERRAARMPALDRLPDEGMRSRPDDVTRSYPQSLSDADPAAFEQYGLCKLTNDPESFRILARMVMASDIQARLSEIKAPVLGVGGRLDAIRAPEGTAAIVGRIAGSRFETIESGHYMPRQTPLLVAKTISGFLARLSAPPDP